MLTFVAGEVGGVKLELAAKSNPLWFPVNSATAAIFAMARLPDGTLALEFGLLAMGTVTLCVPCAVELGVGLLPLLASDMLM